LWSLAARKDLRPRVVTRRLWTLMKLRKSTRKRVLKLHQREARVMPQVAAVAAAEEEVVAVEVAVPARRPRQRMRERSRALRSLRWRQRRMRKLRRPAAVVVEGDVLRRRKLLRRRRKALRLGGEVRAAEVGAEAVALGRRRLAKGKAWGQRLRRGEKK